MKFFCCTNNLTGCKIVGGVQIALNVIYLMLLVVAIHRANAANAMVNKVYHQYSQHHPAIRNYHHQASTTKQILDYYGIGFVLFGGGILCGILLVVGASKRSATMLMVWIVLNGICIGWYVYQLFKVLGLMTAKALIEYLALIGLGIWAELIAIGARQDVKKSGANIA